MAYKIRAKLGTTTILDNLSIESITTKTFSTKAKASHENLSFEIYDDGAINSFVNAGCQIMSFDGYYWARIYNQDGVYGGFFTSTTAKSNTATNLFSALNLIGNAKQSDGTYEFLLEYPEAGSIYNGYYNRWSQTSNPLTTAAETVTGYKAIHVIWTTTSTGASYPFGGLCLSSSGDCYMDCEPNHSNWWYAIASYNKYGTDTGIPGYNSTTVNRVALWIKIEKDYHTPQLFRDYLTPLMFYNGKKYARIMYQHVNLGGYFTSSNASFNNEPYRYSLLYAIPNFLVANKYEFILEYAGNPGGNKNILSGNTYFQNWTQTNDPTTTTQTSSGYTAIHTFSTGDNFGALSLTGGSNTYMDCEPSHGNWYWAVASYVSYGTYGIPATSGGGLDSVRDTSLWIRYE